MKKLKNIHPGEILLEEFLEPMQISAYRLAKSCQIPQTRVAAILKGKRGISADTALRLAAFFKLFAMREIKYPLTGRKMNANNVSFQLMTISVASEITIMTGDLSKASNVPITLNSISMRSLVMREMISPLRSLVK